MPILLVGFEVMIDGHVAHGNLSCLVVIEHMHHCIIADVPGERGKSKAHTA